MFILSQTKIIFSDFQVNIWVTFFRVYAFHRWTIPQSGVYVHVQVHVQYILQFSITHKHWISKRSINGCILQVHGIIIKLNIFHYPYHYQYNIENNCKNGKKFETNLLWKWSANQIGFHFFSFSVSMPSYDTS